MKQPKTLAETPLGQSWIEILVLYVLTTVGASILFELHWALATIAAPVIMLATLVVVMAGVQSLWMLVVGMEKVGVLVGVRKSPLA
jgi:ATP/ADP translocase